jgi:hypothetical protein
MGAAPSLDIICLEDGKHMAIQLEIEFNEVKEGSSTVLREIETQMEMANTDFVFNCVSLDILGQDNLMSQCY